MAKLDKLLGKSQEHLDERRRGTRHRLGRAIEAELEQQAGEVDRGLGH